MSKRRNIAISIIRENPNVVSGALVFGCMFALIAGNALYSQPGAHPGPIWNTRDVLTTNSVAQAVDADSPTDLAIRQAATTQPASVMPQPVYFDLAYLETIGVPTRRPRFAAIQDFEMASSSPQPDIALPTSKSGHQVSAGMIEQTQKRLKKLGLYNGVVDGLYGPATKRAIETFQINAGLSKTGEPSPSLLFSINQTIGLIAPDAGTATSSTVDTLATEALPQPVLNQQARIEPQTQAAADASPDVVSASAASLAATAVKDIAVIAPVETGSDPVDEAPFTDQGYEREMTRLAQKGLAVFGVEGIEPDGILTPLMVDALKRFQERYQLETSGKPDEPTIRKMMDIGALRRG